MPCNPTNGFVSGSAVQMLGPTELWSCNKIRTTIHSLFLCLWSTWSRVCVGGGGGPFTYGPKWKLFMDTVLYDTHASTFFTELYCTSSCLIYVILFLRTIFSCANLCNLYSTDMIIDVWTEHGTLCIWFSHLCQSVHLDIAFVVMVFYILIIIVFHVSMLLKL